MNTTHRSILATLLGLALAPLAPAANVTWNLTVAGAWDTTTGNWTGGSPVANKYVDASADSATFNNTAGGTITIQAAGVTPLSTTVSATSGAYVFSGGAIKGGTLTKSGAGSLELAYNGTNTVTSPITLSGGTLIADYAGSLGGSGVTVNLATGATLSLNATSVSFANPVSITGSGNATIQGRYTGSGVGGNTLGALNIGGQQLTIGWGGNGGTGMNLTFGAVTMSGSPTFTVNNEGSGNPSTVTLGAVGESGGSRMLTMTDPGTTSTLKLSAAGTYSGGTTVNSGILEAAVDYSMGSGAVAVNNNGTLRADTAKAMVSSADSTTPLPIALAAGSTLFLANTTAGSFNFGNNLSTASGTGTYTIKSGNAAGITNTLGTLAINGNQTIQSGSWVSLASTVNFGAVTLGGNANFAVSGTASSQAGTWVLGAVSETGGSRALTMTGNAGVNSILTLSGAGSYSGGTAVTGGYLNASADYALGSGSVTVNGGSAAVLNAYTVNALRSSATGNPLPITLGAASGTNGGTLNLLANTTTGFNNNVTITGSGTAYVNVGFPTTPTKNGMSQNLGTLTIGAQTLSVPSTGTNRNGGSLFGPNFSGVTLTGTATFDVPNEGSGNKMQMNLGPIGQSGGTYGFTKSSAGVLALTSANSYGGATTVNGGTLSVLNVGGLGASTVLSIASGAVVSLDTVGAAWVLPGSVTGAGSLKVNNNYLTVGDNVNTAFTGLLDAGSSVSGYLRFTNSSALVPTIVLNGTNAVTLAAVGGPRTLGTVTNNSNSSTYNVAAGSDLTLTSMTGVGSVPTTINIAAGTNLNFSAVTGSVGNPNPSITVNGYGTLNLNSANTGFNAPQLGIGNGGMTRLNLNADNAVGSVGAKITLYTRGTIGSTGAHTFTNEIYAYGAGIYNFDVTNGNLAFDHIQAFNVNNGQAYFSVLGGNVLTLTNGVYQSANTLNFTKIGPGTMAIAGTSTSYAGSTTVAAGTLVLQAKNAAAAYTAATTANGGTLQLDFNGLGGSNQTNLIAATSPLALGGGTLNLKGLAANTNAQTFASATFNAGASSITATQNGATSLSLALSGLTRNPGSTVDFALPSTGSVTTTSTTFVSNSVLVSAASNGIAFATVGGTDWAANAAGTIGILGSYSTGNANYLAANNVDVTNGDAPASGITVNTLRFNAATDALTLAGINTVATGGILVTSAATNASMAGGTIKPGAGNQLVIINNGAIGIGAIIADGGAASPLTVSGPGTTTLTNTNTYSSHTYVNAGTLSISSNANLGAVASNLNVYLNGGTLQATANINLYNGAVGTNNRSIVIGNNGGTLNVTGTNTLTVAGVISGAAASATVPSLTKTGTGTLTLLNANSFTGTALISGGTLRLVNNFSLQTSVLDTSGAGSFDLSPLSAATGANAVLGAAPVLGGLTGSGVLSIPANTALVLSPNNGVYNSCSGSLTGSGTLVMAHPTAYGAGGIQILTAGNSYSGGTVVNGGTLVLGGSGTLGNTAGPLTVAYAPFYSSIAALGVLDLGYGSQTVGAVTLAGGTIQNGILTGSSYAMQFGTASAILAGTGSLTKTSLGTLALSGNNLYSGPTNINGGVVYISGYQNLGDSSATNTITMSGGAVLEQAYNTTNDLGVNRALALTGNAVLQSDSGPNGGPGMLIVSGPVTLGGNTLAFRGNYGSNNIASGNATISGNIGGTGGSIAKTWGGTLTLSGTNGYTGGTTVTGGVLRADAGAGIPSTGNLALNGGVWESYAVTTFAPVTGTGSGQVQLANYAGFSAYNATNVNLSLNGGAALQWGGTTGFNPGTFVLNESTANSQLTLQNALDLNGAVRPIAVNANTAVISGVLSDSGSGGGITKLGPGTLTLTTANSYAGPTAVNRGVLIADTTTTSGILNSASALQLGGGTFRLTGRSGTAQTQTLNGLTLNPGSSIVDANNVAGATSTTVDLRGTGGTTNITRNPGATVDFRASTGTFGTTAIVRTHSANDATGILGAWATVNLGADLAANDGADKVVAYSGYSNLGLGGAIADSVTTNYKINGAGVGGNLTLGSATTTINTLMQKWTAAATVDTAAKVLRLGAVGGILLTPGNQALTIGTAAGSGTLTAGGADNTAGELVVLNNSSNALTLNSVIANNGSGTVRLTVGGTGTGATSLAATTNSFTGGVTYSATGDLNANGAGSLGTGPLVVNSSGTTYGLNVAANQTVASLSGSAVGAFRMNGGVTFKFGTDNSDSTYLGRITNSGNGAVIKTGTGAWTWGDATSSPNQPYGLTVAQGTVNFGQNNMVTAISVDPTQNNGGTQGATANLNNTTQFFGISFNNLTAGTWTLNTGANGVLYANSAYLSVASGTPTATVNGTVYLSTGVGFDVRLGGTLEFNGTVNGVALWNGGNSNGTIKFSGSTSNNLDFAGGSVGGYGFTHGYLLLNKNDGLGAGGTNQGALAISGDLILTTGNYVQYLQNNQLGDASNVTITGATLDFNGKTDTIGSLNFTTVGAVVNLTDLSLSSTGTALTLRTGTNGNGTLTTGSSTIRLTGASGGGIILNPDLAVNNTNRIPSLGTGSGDTLDLGSAIRAVNVPNINTVAQTAQGVAYDAVIKATITGAGGLTKTGPGTLQLNAANTFAGDTLVSAGELKLNNLSALQNSTLDTGASGAQVVNLVASGTYNLGGLKGADDLAFGANTLSVGANGQSTTYSGGITGTSGGLIKVGAGALTLSGTSSYSGTTTVSDGALLVTGALSSGGDSVAAGKSLAVDGTLGGSGTLSVAGTLSGTGTIAKTVAVTGTGTIMPGHSIGQFNVTGDVGFASTSSYSVEFNTGGADLLNITGSLTPGGATIVVTDLGTEIPLSTGTNYTIAQYGGSLFGTFAGVSGPDRFTYTLDYGTAGSVILNVIPEPTALTLLAAGGLLLAPRRRR